MADDDLRISVTDADIRAATLAWFDALDGDAPQRRVDLLHDDLERLIRLQAVQDAAAGRLRPRRRPAPTPAPRPGR